jgi:hypothetical protein
MSELFAASASGTLREAFCVCTAVVVIPPARIGWQRSSGGAGGGTAEGGIEVKVHAVDVEDIALPVVGTGDGPLDLQRLSGNNGSRNTRDPD